MTRFAPLLVNRDSTQVPTGICKYHQPLIESPSTTPNLLDICRTKPRAVGSSKALVDVELVVLADAVRLAATSLQALGVMPR
ncbi:hypothetical protein FXN61_37805 [Lentzea sp. PSKA42]|uniref:Uncharacterized protein n=1 Tax=Lentzea indica TaxID=2604800 RepID=A0ABX1FTP0_9PSEU|nr:hypothetical protein [Lentzea indica]NKE62194.1 hypothetical protein [Lentzea indica]